MLNCVWFNKLKLNSRKHSTFKEIECNLNFKLLFWKLSAVEASLPLNLAKTDAVKSLIELEVACKATESATADCESLRFLIFKIVAIAGRRYKQSIK